MKITTQFNFNLVPALMHTQIRIASRCMTICLAMFLVSFQAAAQPSVTAESLQRLDRLENTVRAQESIRAVKKVQQAYSHFLADGLWSEIAALCSKQVSAEIHINGTVKILNGKAELTRYLMQRAGRESNGLGKGQLNQNYVLQPIVNVSENGKVVLATWHEFSMLGQFGKTATFEGSIYENEYTYENGAWKIARLRLYQQFAGGFEEWGHKAPPAWGVPYHFDAKHLGVTIPRAVIDAAAPASKQTPAARISHLAQRIQQLNDESDVRNLHNAFAYYLDRKRWDDVVDLIADNGTMEMAATGTFTRPARIRQALESLYGPAGLKTGQLFDHINMSAVVSVSSDGTQARIRSNQLSMLGQNGEYARWEVGVYENEFVKQHGLWKIQAIHYYPRVISNFDDGWAKQAQPAPTMSDSLKPDAQSPTYRSYPEIQYVGYHYANPVTNKRVRLPQGPAIAVPALVSKPVRYKSNQDDIAAPLQTLEKQLDNAVAMDAVENLNSSYGYYIDESAWDHMADTFGSTGSKEITGAGVYVGPDRIRKVLNLRGPRGGRTGNFFTIHQLTQPVIHIAADGLSANARMRLFQCGGSADGSSGSWIGGAYENTAIKENGEWKFGRQELYHNFNASYRNGWARVGKAAAQSALSSSSSRSQNAREVIGGGIQQGLGGAAGGPTIAAQFPPDRPIVVRQYGFPEIVEPPFHYANLVSGKRY